MVPFSFGGHALLALPQGALFWPQRRALLVADLHFEKASWFALRGQVRERRDRIIGRQHLPAQRAQDMLRSLTDSTRWTWITGNHDRAILDRCGGEVVDEAVVDGLVLRHEADRAEARPELSGHFHPKLRVRVRGKQVARRCFVATATKLILPAFGSLTGGLDVDHPEIVRAVGVGAEALVPVADRMLRFPVAA
jgi:metallophosphoesterase superfamily enzyme